MSSRAAGTEWSEGGSGSERVAEEEGVGRPDSVDVKVLAAADRALQKCDNMQTRTEY